MNSDIEKFFEKIKLSDITNKNYRSSVKTSRDSNPYSARLYDIITNDIKNTIWELGILADVSVQQLTISKNYKDIYSLTCKIEIYRYVHNDSRYNPWYRRVISILVNRRNIDLSEYQFGVNEDIFSNLRIEILRYFNNIDNIFIIKAIAEKKELPVEDKIST